MSGPGIRRTWFDCLSAAIVTLRGLPVPVVCAAQGAAIAGGAALLGGASPEKVTLLGGVNLAMLLALVTWREDLPRDELAQRIVDKGRQAVTVVGAGRSTWSWPASTIAAKLSFSCSSGLYCCSVWPRNWLLKGGRRCRRRAGSRDRKSAV